MNGAELQRLALAREQAARRLAERMQADDAPLAELRELSERLKLYDAALADPDLRRSSRRRALVASIAAVALIVSLAAAVPMPSVPFSLELTADSAALRLPEAGQLDGVPLGGELRISGFTSLDSADAELVQAARARKADRVAIRAETLRLRGIRYPAGTLLRLESGAGEVSIGIEAPTAAVGAEIEMSGATTAVFGSTRRSTDYGAGEWLRAVAGDAGSPQRRPPPLDLAIATREPAVAWSGLSPQALEFVGRQGAGATARVVSSLRGATIALPATGSQVALRAGDGLSIDGIEAERCRVALGRDVKVELAGSARRLVVRSGGFERSLKPSVLEFVARHHTIGLLWGAALFLWGATGWLRKLFGA